MIVDFEASAMPNGFAKIIGQEEVLERLKAFVASCRNVGKQPGHILLVGPDGMGKRTIARALADEFQLRPLHDTQELNESFKRIGDVTGVVTTMEAGSALLISDIHRWSERCLEILVDALADFKIDILIGQGKEARRHTLALQPFTCIATAPSEAKVPRAGRDGFAFTASLEAYSAVELTAIAAQIADAMS
jgi:Holliday junction DNA helicase RuvB